MPSRVLRVSNMLFSPLRFRSRLVGCPRGSLPPSSPVLHGYFICTDTAHPVTLSVLTGFEDQRHEDIWALLSSLPLCDDLTNPRFASFISFRSNQVKNAMGRVALFWWQGFVLVEQTFDSISKLTKGGSSSWTRDGKSNQMRRAFCKSISNTLSTMSRLTSELSNTLSFQIVRSTDMITLFFCQLHHFPPFHFYHDDLVLSNQKIASGGKGFH